MKKRAALLAMAALVLSAGLVVAGGEKEAAAGDKLHIVIATDATWPPMEMMIPFGFSFS